MKLRTWHYALLSLLIIAVGYFAILYSDYTTIHIWGHKTDSIFDLWSIQHILAGVIMSYLLSKYLGIRGDLKALAFWVVTIAISWEALELLIELGYLGEWLRNWKNGVEFWGNRIIVDPVAALLGLVIYIKVPRVLTATVLIAAIFLLINISLPNSTYLQRVILHI